MPLHKLQKKGLQSVSILPVIDESCNIPMFSCINDTWHHPTNPLSSAINMGTDVVDIATVRVISENNGESA